MQNTIIASVNTDSVAVALSDSYPKSALGKYFSVKQVLKAQSHSFIKKVYRHRANLLLMTLAILVFALPHLVRAEDLLASQKGDAKDTFGHGSTVEWGLYIAEIILSIGAYIKVRNPMILVGGIPFLIVITRVFFSLAG